MSIDYMVGVEIIRERFFCQELANVKSSLLTKHCRTTYCNRFLGACDDFGGTISTKTVCISNVLLSGSCALSVRVDRCTSPVP